MPLIISWLRKFQHRLSNLYFDENNVVSRVSHKSHHSILLVLFFAVIILPIMAFAAWISGDIERSLVLFVILVICLTILYYEKQNKQIKYVKEILVFTIACLIFYLLIYGGLENTGALWCYPLSIILFMFYGAKSGLQLNFFIIVITSIIFIFNPFNILATTYSYVQQTRFVFTFFLLNLFTFIITYAEELLIISLNRTRDALQKANVTDDLTGLGNRRFIKNALESIDRRYNSDNQLVAVLMIDIDKFKDINDTYGHHIGDLSLIHIAKNIKIKIRKTDLIARWGGEEFLVVLTNTEKNKVIEIAKNICKHIQSTPYTHENILIQTTVSIGISCFEGESINIEKIIQHADGKLYEAKKTGRNKVVC